ncbi:hypothetical protein [Xanthobacter albus]|uniref:hypothetical protein n=1 Tax=Xanthobacter albus TaxID=3119929 RepID=UPI00372BAA50
MPEARARTRRRDQGRDAKGCDAGKKTTLRKPGITTDANRRLEHFPFATAHG